MIMKLFKSFRFIHCKQVDLTVISQIKYIARPTFYDRLRKFRNSCAKIQIFKWLRFEKLNSILERKFLNFFSLQDCLEN